MLGPTPLNTGAFVTVDIEATGCRPGISSIIEIGAVRIEGGAIADHFARFVVPADEIPPAIARLTGITVDMLADAPSIATIIAEFRDFSAGAVLVAHNHRFDMSFLDYEAERAWGSPFPRPILDTLTLARRLHPELPRHNLRDLAAFYGTEHSPSHRAHADALATAEVFLCMLAELESAGMTTAADVARLSGVAQQSRLARKLALATNLPDGPGLYLFRDDHGEVIYVGKAKSLRTRVRNHFYAADDISAPTPASEVTAIEHHELVSALDAALLEVRLHDRYTPIFNRDGHQRRRPLYLHVDTTSEYPTLRATHRRLRSGELLGPLSNEWAATTVANAVCDFFGLRHCGCSLQECRCKACAQRDDMLCRVPDADDEGRESYAAGVRAALAVFDGGSDDFREMLRRAQEQCVRSKRYDEASRYRDALRALDRTLSALATARRAAAEGVVVVLEGDDEHLAAVVTVHGWHLTTQRFARDQIVDGSYQRRLAIALERAVQHLRSNPAVTPRRLRDMSIIDAYRQQHAPVAVIVGDDTKAGIELVTSTVRRLMRVPKKRHAAASAD